MKLQLGSMVIECGDPSEEKVDGLGLHPLTVTVAGVAELLIVTVIG